MTPFQGLNKKKLLFAVGGTGGHVFPAQALARELGSEHEIVFGGGKLGSNPLFDRELFKYKEVRGSSPFRGKPIQALVNLSRGVMDSLKLISEFSPDLVIGFGSFYSFPLLVAARIKRVPYILVESNALPGKVNRLFSGKAKTSAIQFPEAIRRIKGEVTVTRMPLWSTEASLSALEAREYFGLKPDLFTLLVLGGSQGSAAINEAVASIRLDFPHQVLHLAGKTGDLEKHYAHNQVHAVVKPFEKQMSKAYQACDLAICRSGAGTLTELIHFALPAILVPWPGASENHQHLNAQSMQKSGGIRLLEEKNLYQLKDEILAAIDELSTMKMHLKAFQESLSVETLKSVVEKQLEQNL